MRKKIVSILVAICLVMPLTVAISAADSIELNDKGLSLNSNSFGGAFIKTSDVGLEAGKSYTIEYVVKAVGTTGFRVRYTDGDGSSGMFRHNDEKDQAHSASSAIASGTTANQIPALFEENTIGSNEIKLLTVNFTFGEEIESLDPLTMDYIGIFGLRGGDSYEVLGMRLKDAFGTEIASVGDMNISDDNGADTTDSITNEEPGEPGTYTRNNFFTLIQDGDIKYQLHLPAKPEEGKKYPILIRLHGHDLHDFVETYPTMGSVGLIEDFIDKVNTNPEQYESYVVMAISSEWGPKPDTVKHIIDRLIQEESADPDRIYIYGFSMGGYAASDFIMAYPDVAAATVLICGASELTSGEAQELLDLPIRIYHSDDDGDVPVEVSRAFYNGLLAAGGDKAEYYEVTGFGHYAWNYAYKTDMVEWMFKQERSASSESVPTSEPTVISTLSEQDTGETDSTVLVIAIVLLIILSATGTVLILVKRRGKKS
jgi:predicted esterase